MRTRSRKPSDGTLRQGGRVTLVGAGPGDPDLLTIKAVRAMQEADVILFDALVSDEVLAFARDNAKRLLVGKRGHRPSCRQEDINGLMLKLARQGKHVVRLKCGDPVLFGRAGEEIAHLTAAGIPVNIVPGITSASAMASAFNVSLTHRAHSQSVRFVTGHAKDGAMPKDLDWKGLADATTTLVDLHGRPHGSGHGAAPDCRGVAGAYTVRCGNVCFTLRRDAKLRDTRRTRFRRADDRERRPGSHRHRQCFCLCCVRHVPRHLVQDRLLLIGEHINEASSPNFDDFNALRCRIALRSCRECAGGRSWGGMLR